MGEAKAGRAATRATKAVVKSIVKIWVVLECGGVRWSRDASLVCESGDCVRDEGEKTPFQRPSLYLYWVGTTGWIESRCMQTHICLGCTQVRITSDTMTRHLKFEGTKGGRQSCLNSLKCRSDGVAASTGRRALGIVAQLNNQRYTVGYKIYRSEIAILHEASIHQLYRVVSVFALAYV